MKINDTILSRVQKPAAYAGGELNSVVKKTDEIEIRYAFCFPDVYEIGMSHLGMKILYHLLNERKDTWCERVFAPMADMENEMRQNEIRLFALESGDEIKDFDTVAFTLQYEMSYTNILNMLNLAGLPLRSADRDNGYPIVCCGGPCAMNPEPLAPFIDYFVIGEGEEVMNEILDIHSEWKKKPQDKMVLLKQLAQVSGVYVPAFYNTEYHRDGTIKEMTPQDDVPPRIRKRIVSDLDHVYFPDKIIVPYLDIVHDRIMLELFRGCIRGCRFCQAGYIYRPTREKKAETLAGLAKKLVEHTGYEEIGLVSLSTSDYTQLEELVSPLVEECEKKRVSFSLPSLRIDSFSIDLMKKAQKVRKSGLTFAPEAGTQRLRDVINKGVNEDDLYHSCKIAFEGGWSTVKLYFMIGLPTETIEDVEGIAQLSYGVVNEWKNVMRENSMENQRHKNLSLNVSTSTFVPKAFTPFQWESQDDISVIQDKQFHLKDIMKRNKKITYKYHDPYTSRIEAALARGDRRVADVLEIAWKKGCKFDSWDEYFNYDQWLKAFEEAELDLSFYANRKRSFEEILPWDHIDVGISKDYLIKEAKNAYKEMTTKNCRDGCSACGISAFYTERSVCKL